jgi:uncharacterized protein YgiM (DUF1202 family)
LLLPAEPAKIAFDSAAPARSFVRADLGGRMKRLPQLFALIILIANASPAHAVTTGYAKCESYDSYVMFYRSLEQFDVQGKIKCGEGFEILSRWNEYLSIRTLDGKQGWVEEAQVTLVPPAAAKGAATPSAPLTNENVLDMLRLKFSSDVIMAKIKASPCDFDTSPAALKHLKQSLVPDRVIQVMVQAPLATPSAAKAEPTTSPTAAYIPR